MAGEEASGAAQGASMGAMLGPVGAVAGGIMGGLAGRSAKKKAKKMMKANLKLHDLNTRDNLKQMQREADQVMGEGRGKVYASNVMMSGSSKSYLAGLETELMGAMSSFKQRAAAERKAIKLGGKSAQGAASTMGFQSLLGGLATGAQMIWGK